MIAVADLLVALFGLCLLGVGLSLQVGTGAGLAAVGGVLVFVSVLSRIRRPVA